MSKKPEQIITDNEFGTILMGPIGEEGRIGENIGTNMIMSLKAGHNQTYTMTGNKGEIVPGCSHEIVGTNLKQDRNESEKENIAKSINAENGDIVLNAENGNIKLRAKNIYIESVGPDSDGSVLIRANDHIIIGANEQINLVGGKVCVTSSDSVTINATGFIRLLSKDIIQGSPFSALSSIFSGINVAALIESIANSCK